MAKPVVPRIAAEIDLDETVRHYTETAGAEVAVEFLIEFEAAAALISQHPAGGSPRYGFDPSLAGIRFWPLKRFPHLIFYIETEDQIDVWRVMHASMDISAELSDPGSTP